MCNDENFVCYSTKLWSYYDSSVSNNEIGIETFTSKSNGFLSNTRMRFYVRNKSSNCSIYLGNAELFRLIESIKKFFITPWADNINSLKKDISFTKSMSISCKKMLYITFMTSPTVSSGCFRIMIGDRESSILDSEKGYIPPTEFLSFYQTLNQIFNNYVNIAMNASLIDQINDLKASNSVLMTNLPKATSVPQITKEPEPIVEKKEEAIDLDLNDDPKAENNQFTSYLKENRDKFDIDLVLDDDVKKKLM